MGEVVSNAFLAGEDRWTSQEEERLRSLGWQAPEPEGSPNWNVVICPTFTPPVSDVASLVIGTMPEVLGITDRGRVRVKLFSSPNRGHTPASEVVATSERR
jgi:hypothetical protein